MKFLGAVALSLLLPLSLAAQAPPTRGATLQWTDEQPGVFYNVYRFAGPCADATAFDKLNAAPVTSKSYADAGLAPGHYCYVVTAQTGDLESEHSNRAAAAAKPFAPRDVTIVVEIVLKTNGEVLAKMKASPSHAPIDPR